MRNGIRNLRAQLFAFLMICGLTVTTVAAPANVYDKFRGETYTNDGLMSEQDEVRLGHQVHQQVLQKYRLVEDPEIAGYVQQLGERVARASVRPNLQYHFFVVDDPSVNAFSIPGGLVYVNTGLLQLVQSEDELAAVLGHEVNHIVARHGLRNLKRAQKTQVATGIVGILAQVLTRGSAGGRAISAGAQLLGAGYLTRHSRDFEREADYLGLYNIHRAGYEPAGMVQIFHRLGQAQGRAQSSIGGIFASHPDARERIHNTQVEIEQHLGRQYAQRDRYSDRYDSDTAYGRGRRRLSRSSGGGFEQMKEALASYRSGRRGWDRNRQYRPRGNDPYDDRYDRSEEYNPPPLRRRPSRP